MDASVRTSPRSGVRLERFKSKYLKPQTLTSVLWVIVRAIILLGLCYIILYPFFIKIINAFKTYSDFIDPTVRFLPKNFTLDNIKHVINDHPHHSLPEYNVHDTNQKYYHRKHYQLISYLAVFHPMFLDP